MRCVTTCDKVSLLFPQSEELKIARRLRESGTNDDWITIDGTFCFYFCRMQCTLVLSSNVSFPINAIHNMASIECSSCYNDCNMWFIAWCNNAFNFETNRLQKYRPRLSHFEWFSNRTFVPCFKSNFSWGIRKGFKHSEILL